MYWPVGTARIYATSAVSLAVNSNATVSHDGLQPPRLDSETSAKNPTSSADDIRDTLGPNQTPVTPLTPATPLTPNIRSVEQDVQDEPVLQTPTGAASTKIRLTEPILALRAARSGHLFAVITSTSITIWQTKPTVILAIVVRSEASLDSYGTNINLLLRPDSAILVVRTSLGYLITYSLATDPDSTVYKPHFVNHTNVQRRRQSHIGGPGHEAPDQILYGPGEGFGIRDVSVRFRMVIKVDAGIESALALDDELIVATRKPAAIQCIRWTPDSSGTQTSTEILSRMDWLGKKVTIKEMTHDRPMNLSAWVTSDGQAFAVQRISRDQASSRATEASDAKKLFHGYCFHVPQSPQNDAVLCVINARFSLIAVGCEDGSVQVYSARDYAGNIPHSHTHKLSVSKAISGKISTLSYSSDGYCLFVGYEKGWATWSVYGKPLSASFSANATVALANGEAWAAGVVDAAWIGGSSEILLAARSHEAVWVLEMARSAVTTCYSSVNLFRTVLQTASSVMVYRGYDLPDLTSISAEPFLWHTTRLPAMYLLKQWPIRCTVTSPDGRYIAVAGRRGLAHYSVSSGRWRTFRNEDAENEFQVRGGMCWYQNILVVAVEVGRTHELRLYSREAVLDTDTAVFVQKMSAPVVLVAPSGEDSLLVYTHDNLLCHFVFASASGSMKIIQVGQIAFHGIVRSPARVRGLSWLLPESQVTDGDPSQDVAVASVLFLVDGKLVLLRPVNDEGQLKYEMRVISQNVEYYISMRDQPFGAYRSQFSASEKGPQALPNSLWIFDGSELKTWVDMDTVLRATSGDSTWSRELPPTISIPIDFYPLSILIDKATVLGVESDLVQRRDVCFSLFRFSIRTHLFLPDILRNYLTANRTSEALSLARQYQNLEYFAHGLEILLHQVLDQEVDINPPPAPANAVLPRVLTLLSSFKQYLDIVVQCTRKTEVRSWRTLFAYLPPPQELFEESLQQGRLKTAGGYLLILHTFDELATASEQSMRLLKRAVLEDDWELCKELARFLAALDETGDTLRTALDAVNIGKQAHMVELGLGIQMHGDGELGGNLDVTGRSINGSPDSGSLERRLDMNALSPSDVGSIASGSADGRI
ncbi:hypothetical protein VTK73DRAFT_7673 [Phialemonium thermophilum]|uniref:RIC1 C-terminal alpha solenoid region domain-containing protein n=1 Tax=Phialemonium thermophilum TaxID=223376 RepID=A0ABR3Y6G4_9PEZI